MVRSMESRILTSRWLRSMIGVSLAAAVLFAIGHPHFLWGDHTRESAHLHEFDTFHAALEAVIGIAAMVLGFNLWSGRLNPGKPVLRFLAFGFWPMGTLGLIHSAVSVEQTLVFLYAGSTLAGGLGFSLCWFSALERLERRSWRVPVVVIAASLAFGMTALATSAFGLTMIEGQSFTVLPRALNFMAGLLFAAAAVRLVSEALNSEHNWGIYVLSGIAVVGATAGLSFPFSQAWSHGWWGHHVLRLAAFGIAWTVLYVQAVRSEREKAQTLIDSEERLRGFLDSTDDLVTQVDGQGRLTYVNRASEGFFGLPAEDVIGLPAFDFVHPDDREMTQTAFASWIENREEHVAFENRAVATNGKVTDLFWAINPKYDEAGNVRYVWSIARDISERKTYEESLIQARQKSAQEKAFSDSVINSLPGVFYLFDEQLRFQRWNENFERVTGYNSEEMAQLSPLQLFDQDDAPRVAERIQETFDKGRSSVEADFLSKDGTKTPYLFTGLLIQIEGSNYLIGVGIDISDLRRIQEQLRASESKFRNLTEAAPVGIFQVALSDMIFTYVNPAIHRILGFQPGELVGRLGPPNLTHPESLDAVKNTVDALVRDREPKRLTFKGLKKGGGSLSCDATVALIDTPDGPAIIGTLEDITQRIEDERERDQMLHDLGERVKEQRCVYTVSEAAQSCDSLEALFGKTVDAIKAGWQYTDVTRVRIVFDDIISMNVPFEPTEFKLATDLCVDGIRRGTVEVYYMEKCPDHDIGSFLFEEKRLLDSIANMLGAAIKEFMVNREIRARQNLAESFLESSEEAAYSKALQAVLDAVDAKFGMFGYVDEEGALVYPSITRDIWEKCTTQYKDIRFPRDTWGGLWGRSLMEKRTLIQNGGLSVPKGHIPITNTITTPVLFKDEVVGHINLANKSRDFNRDDQVLLERLAAYLAPILHARLEQKFISDALERERAQLKSLFDSTDDIIYVADPNDDTLVYVNRTFRDIWGDDVIGKKCYQVLQDRRSPCPFCTNDKIFGENLGKTHLWEFQNETNQRWYRCADKAIKWSDGRHVRFEMATDITESKLLAQEQIRLEKFTVLGRVAAGVAHELNNPLMGILNYAQYCLEETEKESTVSEVLHDIEHETKRCVGIVQNLLSASRMDDVAAGVVTTFDPETVIDRVIRLLEYRTSKEGVIVTKSVNGAIPDLTMSSEAFQQMVMNLFTNAVDALEDATTKEIHIKLKSEAGNAVIEIADSGCGITQDLREKIFDPFFTTKAPGKGTGLGLATCARVAQSQGGHLSCKSKPGYGTTMTVTLPPADRDIRPTK